MELDKKNGLDNIEDPRLRCEKIIGHYNGILIKLAIIRIIMAKLCTIVLNSNLYLSQLSKEKRFGHLIFGNFPSIY